MTMRDFGGGGCGAGAEHPDSGDSGVRTGAGGERAAADGAQAVADGAPAAGCGSHAAAGGGAGLRVGGADICAGSAGMDAGDSGAVAEIAGIAGAPAPERRSLLLHVCCGPCAIYPVRALAAEGAYSVSGLFLNPNIHPEDEHKRRMAGAKALFAAEGLPLECSGGSEQGEWEAYGLGREQERCAMCYRRRLRDVAQTAARRGFDAFSTSLLISPYQKHGMIKAICEELSASLCIEFMYRDFRPHFREGQQLAKDAGLYRQKYCGCILSLAEARRGRA
ncbi:MAG: epoxyqueuosine reductase QueH [Clostridiales bacterium]|nr:epoxyqueuosine reductase QueH [Clostridiales bacterium]